MCFQFIRCLIVAGMTDIAKITKGMGLVPAGSIGVHGHFRLDFVTILAR
jgi:hypothetical protein